MTDSSRQRWVLTPDEFAWVWTETGSDVYPDPISILESPTTEDEYHLLTRAISVRYPRGDHPELTDALRVLADPDLRIIGTGYSHRFPEKRLRVVAAAVGESGAVVVQRSGPTAEVGGDIQVFTTPRATLARHVAAAMPPSTAGPVERMVGYTPRIRGDEPPTTYFQDSIGRPPVEERIRAFLRAPRAAEGHFTIATHVSRGAPPTYLSWVDIREDRPAAGRYLISVDENQTTVSPAAREDVQRHLSRSISVSVW
ncbi:ESX secretion-associated protein EspG [Nocardia carnea]|uniref:ESX secretion-associated protein EspG n=1 Tax=Nocardia carnea TaxID=37328 RepID=A0ABW7TEG5_9NOCA|nr:ESX secretion-associated protein EspG [Nocardia carnea]